jgi:hypothetical protein
MSGGQPTRWARPPVRRPSWPVARCSGCLLSARDRSRDLRRWLIGRATTDRPVLRTPTSRRPRSPGHRSLRRARRRRGRRAPGRACGRRHPRVRTLPRRTAPTVRRPCDRPSRAIPRDPDAGGGGAQVHRYRTGGRSGAVGDDAGPGRCRRRGRRGMGSAPLVHHETQGPPGRSYGLTVVAALRRNVPQRSLVPDAAGVPGRAGGLRAGDPASGEELSRWRAATAGPWTPPG